jgi:hypothetical protein
MFQTKIVQKIKTHILCSVTFFSENLAISEITWKNIVERSRLQMTIWRMQIECWIPRATNTHLEYVTLISTATVVTRRHLIVTLYVHLLFLLSLNRKMLYIREPGLSLSSSKDLLLPFARSTWWAMLAAILLFTVCLAATWHLGSRHVRRQNDDVYGLYNSAFCMIGVCCRQSKLQRFLPPISHATQLEFHTNQ